LIADTEIGWHRLTRADGFAGVERAASQLLEAGDPHLLVLEVEPPTSDSVVVAVWTMVETGRCGDPDR